MTGVVSIAFVVVGGLATAGSPAMTLRCTNPSSGASWDIPIDSRNGTANSFPAAITAESIKWRDTAHGGNYEFDRVSGELTVIYESSTGGFFLRDNCRFLQGSDAAPKKKKKGNTGRPSRRRRTRCNRMKNRWPKPSDWVLIRVFRWNQGSRS